MANKLDVENKDMYTNIDGYLVRPMDVIENRGRRRTLLVADRYGNVTETIVAGMRPVGKKTSLVDKGESL